MAGAEGEWREVEDTPPPPLHTREEQGDVQASERRRRLLAGSRNKSHRRYLQDIVAFLWGEASSLSLGLEWRQRQEGRDTLVRVSMGPEVGPPSAPALPPDSRLPRAEAGPSS